HRARLGVAFIMLGAAAGCGGGGGPGDATPDSKLPPPPGSVSADLRTDHVGYRTGDVKRPALLGHAGASVEVRRAADGTAAATVTAGATAQDEDSGDALAIVDFTSVTAAGDYYLYLPSEQVRSYTFTIADDVYDIVGAVAMKSFYYQRCNHDKA